MACSEMDIERVNKGLSPEGQIYWQWNRDYTSKKWQRMSKEGWYVRRVNEHVSTKILYRPDGTQYGLCFGTVDLLVTIDQLG